MAENPGHFQFELVLSGRDPYVLNLRQFPAPRRQAQAGCVIVASFEQFTNYSWSMSGVSVAGHPSICVHARCWSDRTA